MDKQKSYRVLFIGNSYTYYNELWELFTAVAQDGGYAVQAHYSVRGGAYLEQSLDAADPLSRQLQALLDTNRYDVVFLQEQSTCPAVQPARFEAAATALHRLIVQNGARCVLYQTWGRQTGSPDLALLGMTNREMTERLRESYEAVGQKLQAAVSPVGTAFFEVHTKYPAIALYDADTTHPALAGSYLAALCHYATVFGEDPRTVSFAAGLDAEQAAVLRQAAYDACFVR